MVDTVPEVKALIEIIPSIVTPVVSVVVATLLMGRLIMGLQISALEQYRQQNADLTTRNTSLEERLDSAEERIGIISREVASCEIRNYRLIRSLIENGINIPEDVSQP